jgi:hypothetical protein
LANSRKGVLAARFISARYVFERSGLKTYVFGWTVRNPHAYRCAKKDWPEELSFIQQFDGAGQDVRSVV